VGALSVGGSARTLVGGYRIYVYPNNTAELTNDRGVLLMKRQALYKVTDRLVQMGISSAFCG
jgi:hypothetical protein